jgi:hypothetical protein
LRAAAGECLCALIDALAPPKTQKNDRKEKHAAVEQDDGEPVHGSRVWRSERSKVITELYVVCRSHQTYDSLTSCISFCAKIVSRYWRCFKSSPSCDQSNISVDFTRFSSKKYVFARDMHIDCN